MYFDNVDCPSHGVKQLLLHQHKAADSHQQSNTARFRRACCRVNLRQRRAERRRFSSRFRPFSAVGVSGRGGTAEQLLRSRDIVALNFVRRSGRELLLMPIPRRLRSFSHGVVYCCSVRWVLPDPRHVKTRISSSSSTTAQQHTSSKENRRLRVHCLSKMRYSSTLQTDDPLVAGVRDTCAQEVALSERMELVDGCGE